MVFVKLGDSFVLFKEKRARVGFFLWEGVINGSVVANSYGKKVISRRRENIKFDFDLKLGSLIYTVQGIN